MSFVAVGVIGGMAALGAVGGAMKSGPDSNRYGREESQKAYEAYKNLVAKGAGEQDITASLGATRDYANQLNNIQSGGLYNQSVGNRLAEQQFAGQRQQLAQSLQDQMAVANRAASSAGRSSNDPILRARLGAEQMRQTASMNAQQASAAQQLGRQSTLDMLSLGSQRVNTLQGLSNQAFSGQQNLFGMGQSLFSMDMGEAQYESSRGGGLKGGITGAVSGAGAGMQMMTGFGGLANSNKMTDAYVNSMSGGATGMGGMDSSSFSMPQMGGSSGFGQAPSSIGKGWSGGFGAAPQFPSMPASLRAPAQSMSSNYATIPNYLSSSYQQYQSPMQTGRWFGN